MRKRVSVAGAVSLLGQHLLVRLSEDRLISVESLHDCMGGDPRTGLLDLPQWQVAPEVARAFSHVPLLSAEAPARASVLLSFLPEDGAAGIEALHLARGTRIITHCEHARLAVPLAMPGVTDIDPGATHLATPNCTTAICALPLQYLHTTHGVTGVTITTLQAISGTDLPGIAAHTIHDRVDGHLAGEADALSDELSIIFDQAFPVDAFATRVPVWRGHTITMSVRLADNADAIAVADTLSGVDGIAVADAPTERERFPIDAPLATVVSLRNSVDGVMMVLKADNLGAATTGIMQTIAHALQV
ncbi:MAG: hypothetical protein ABJN26_04975 [Stappiaceae bacterium]